MLITLKHKKVVEVCEKRYMVKTLIYWMDIYTAQQKFSTEK